MTDELRKSVLEKLERQEYNCPKEITLAMINGKWKINLLYHLSHDGDYYFHEFQELLPQASHKELNLKLQELIADGLVTRTPESTRPVKVNYSITPLGQTLIPIIDQMYTWGSKRLKDLQLDATAFALGKTHGHPSEND
ncbi:helix-turn-helix transcriptional regulator [Lactobacillus sp. DCY120]|uniref:Helix-turn-helix transcriptional regulator n=1 Tax=Bombilactobacillus apium TaxID=2675299 RepID=A0A850R116_9LACO|nr:helix-turn-helix domain-containing protein [Bombilactobacillus apium]NVY96613.1 helix-turn-helix transcriptional regulator [Bombilactobacillus apium]